MIQEPYSERLSRFRRLMAERELDAFLIFVPENRYYLSGFEAEDLLLTESSGCLLITGSKQYLLTDSRYEEEARAECPDFETVIYKTGLTKTLPDLFSDLGTRKLGVEGRYTTYSVFCEIEQALRGARPEAEMVSTEDLVESMRVVKDAGEIERIKASAAHSQKVLRTVWDALAPGRTEIDVAWEIERRIREGGAEAVSFPPIAAAGPNAALPHAVPTPRKIAPGDCVILDMGTKLRHYCSDMTRTWIAGAPDKRLREIYGIVREAQLAAQEAARAGMETNALDAVARDFIGRAGYGDYFGHGLGHGVGIAVHEAPRLSKFKPTILREDMIVTIEPGIYIPGFGGVRLENMIRITGNGCELLNEEDMFYE